MKKISKIVSSMLLVLCLAAGSVFIFGQNVSAAGAVKLNRTKLTMEVGDSYRLAVKNQPKDAKVTWSTSSKGRAAVSSKGLVKAKKQGSATIRAKVAYRSGQKNITKNLSCKVTIRKKAAAAKTLVVYFSAPVAERQNQVDGISSASRTTATGSYKGNTEYLAELISRETGGDLFEIVPEDAYPDVYEQMVERAQEEQKNGARPGIKNRIKNIDAYDTVYVGYPIWWSDMPQIMYTFFDTYDLSGKKIMPFCTHAGSGLSGSVGRIQRLEPDATVSKGLAIYRTDVTGSDSAVKSWIKENELDYCSFETGFYPE